MHEFDNFIKDLSKENIIKEKHEKRFILGINVLAAIWRLITFWKDRGDEKHKSDE